MSWRGLIHSSVIMFKLEFDRAFKVKAFLLFFLQMYACVRTKPQEFLEITLWERMATLSALLSSTVVEDLENTSFTIWGILSTV